MRRLRACRTRTILPESMVLPPALAGELLGRAAGDDLVEDRLLALLLAQQPAEALDVLADGAGPRQNDADVGRRHVHALVEDLARHHDRVLAAVEALEDLL